MIKVDGLTKRYARNVAVDDISFEVEGLQGRAIRPDLARAVVEAGWNLTELRPLAFSLEEIFLQLTASEEAPAAGGEK